MTDERPTPQTAPWFDRLATLQQGYHYPWRSAIGAWHGEDAYLALVRRHLRPGLDVLDVACGHGDIGVELAPQVRSVLAYDRTAPWIDLGRRAARSGDIMSSCFRSGAPQRTLARQLMPANNALRVFWSPPRLIHAFLCENVQHREDTSRAPGTAKMSRAYAGSGAW